MKLTKNFSLEEFIDEPEFKYFGETGIRLINPKLPIIAQGLKEFYKGAKILINTWKWDGDRRESGLRLPRHKNYREYSDHSRGNAFDCVLENIESLQVINDIIKHEYYFMSLGLTIIEKNTKGWNHLSCAQTNKNHIWFINP